MINELKYPMCVLTFHEPSYISVLLNETKLLIFEYLNRID